MRILIIEDNVALATAISHRLKDNGHAVNMVHDGDSIEIKEKSRDLPLVIEAIASQERDVPDYMTVDFAKCKGSYTRQPGLSDVPYPVQMEPNLVIEFYSR